jgi:hypothetical protein
MHQHHKSETEIHFLFFVSANLEKTLVQMGSPTSPPLRSVNIHTSCDSRACRNKNVIELWFQIKF